jgi:hypothetical protein
MTRGNFGAIVLATVALAGGALRCASAATAPLGGFIPLVGIGLTDEYDNGNGLSATFFQAQREDAYVGGALHGVGQPAYFDLALLDTGAATHILTPQAAGPSGFRIAGNGFDGTNTQQIGGATGLITLSINDPLAIFAAGLGDRTSAGTSLVMNTAAMRGQSSVATLSAPTAWKLPNILGLPMAAQHGVVIRNDEPQIFQHAGRTVRTPNVDFIPLGTGNQQGITRRTDLLLRPGSGFIAGPLYVQDPLGILSGMPSENPFSPSVVENGALFVGVDMTHGTRGIQDKEFLFDTGADLTVISQVTAARLGIDVVSDKPDFLLEVEGSGGVSEGVPGYYVDELNIDTVGGSFTLQNVPVAVLDVTNPNNPGNVVEGIVGMHLFTGRNIVIDANPSIGQGGAGPSLYIGNPVYETHTWAAAGASGDWATPGNWSAAGTPNVMWDAQAVNAAGGAKFANVASNSTVYRLTVDGTASSPMTVAVGTGATLTSFGEILVEDDGRLHLASTGVESGRLDAQFINLRGGVLSGEGTIFVGAGPVNGAVRNLGGRIEPTRGAPSLLPVGKLAITGDLANLNGGTLAFDLGGTMAGTQYDQITLSRFAFLGGTLEVKLAETISGTFAPSVGNMFTLITATEGVSGQFDLVNLPSGYFWMVDYQANAVVLKVTGVGTLPGDFDRNGAVNAADLAVWKAGAGTLYDGADLLTWQRNLGTSAVFAAVPEPSAAGLALCGAAVVRRRRTRETRSPRRTLGRG